MNFDQLFDTFGNTRVAVIGDVMLDTYWWGKVDRISPEAPVPVVAVSKKEQRIGGAANVALNLRSLGARVSMLSVTGKDEDGKLLKTLLDDQGIDTRYLVASSERITTNKIRIISRNQHMMRLDAEQTSDLGKVDEEELLAAVEKYLHEEQPAVVILEDYNKGVFTPTSIEKIIALCKSRDIIVTVDPKRNNFFAYKGVDIFKPNLKEAKEGLHVLAGDVDLPSMKYLHQLLFKELEHKISLITLSEKGIFYQQDETARLIPTHVRNIADVSGAGDTVIAVASLVYAATGDADLAAEMANIAGGLVCEEVGTVAIDKQRLLDECKQLLS